MLSLAAVSFWIVRAQGLVYGYFNFLNIARYPDVIFPRLFRFVFGWIIPVVIVANIPARLLIKSLGQPGWLMLHLVIAATIAFAPVARFLAICPAALFQRKFVNSTAEQGILPANQRLRLPDRQAASKSPLARSGNALN